MTPENKDPSYQLTMTKRQAQTLKVALELAARAHHKEIYRAKETGQITRDIVSLLLHQNVSPLALSATAKACQDVFSQYFVDSNVAWDLMQVIRRKIAWDETGNPPKRDWATMRGVDYDDTLKIGSEPLAEIKRVQNQEEN